MIGLLSNCLSWLGRQGTRAVAVSAFLGMALPPVSAIFKPFIPEAIFILLVLAFLRVDPTAVFAHLRRPKLVGAAALWLMIAIPVILAVTMQITGLAQTMPELTLALFIVSAAPPVMSAPAFVSLMGLNGSLSLALLLLSMLLLPLTAPLIGELMLGEALPLDGFELALRLFGLLAATMICAWGVRKLLGVRRVEAAKSQIDGLNVCVLFFFAVAVMDGVAASFINTPLTTLAIVALVFGVALLQIIATQALFFKIPAQDAFVLAHAAGNRNMGVMVAALGGALPEFTWLYFALGQLPIYLLPWMLRPIADRLRKHR